jgi:hypothetical protein
LLAHVLERDVDLVAHLVAHNATDTDSARFSQCFEARREVDAIAEDIVLVDDDVAEVDADAKFDAPLFHHAGIAPRHLALHLDGATHGIDHAVEFGKQAVAGRLHDTTAVLGDLGVSDLAPHLLQGGERAFLVHAHQPRIAGHVSRQDRRQASLKPFLCHRHRWKWLKNLSCAARVRHWRVTARWPRNRIDDHLAVASARVKLR